MIHTNELLSIAFSLIANFTNVVDVPPDSAPRDRNDLAQCIVGSPGRPLDLFLTDRRGNRFAIRAGAVMGFTSRGSFIDAGENARLAEYAGKSILTTNEVLQLADRTLRRLSKSGRIEAGGPPKVRPVDQYQGEPLPIFEVSWPVPAGQLGASVYARMEIDARTAKVLGVSLYAAEFRDPGLEQQIREKVQTADPMPTASARPAVAVRHPTTNQVSTALRTWRIFCDALALDPGPQTTLEHIDWSKTTLPFNPRLSTNVPIYWIAFSNKTAFTFFNGMVYGHLGADAFFLGLYTQKTQQERDAIRGEVRRNWRELAKDMEGRVRSLLSTSGFTLPDCELDLNNGGDRVGTVGCTRAVVEWRKSGDRPTRLFTAEFDLQTGETKYLILSNVELMKQVGAAVARLEGAAAAAGTTRDGR